MSEPTGARLIVNGDDFGLCEAVNIGIVESHRDGILTSTSIMANGDAFEQAAAIARECPTLDIGVHLTLTEQRPVLPAASVPTLVGADGRFPPHAIPFAARYLRGRIALAEIRDELDAQIRRVIDAGLRVSHLDGHQHVHVLPGIARVVTELARAHGIAAVRYPAERLRGYMLTSLRNMRRVTEQLMVACACAFSPLRDLKRTDAFLGFYFGGRLTEANLLKVLQSLPASQTVELMCHPGREDRDSRFRHWGYSWPAEREALLSPKVRNLLATRGVRLISYRDLTKVASVDGRS
jgi:chitin disaccharide deacetylase